MGVRKEERGQGTPCVLKISAEKGCFLVSSGKKQISPLMTPPRNFFVKKKVLVKLVAVGIFPSLQTISFNFFLSSHTMFEFFKVNF